MRNPCPFLQDHPLQPPPREPAFQGSAANAVKWMFNVAGGQEKHCIIVVSSLLSKVIAFKG